MCLHENIVKTLAIVMNRGGSRISGKGVHMYKGVGVGFADFISFFLKYPMKMK